MVAQRRGLYNVLELFSDRIPDIAGPAERQPRDSIMMQSVLIVAAILFEQAKPEEASKERPYWLDVARAHIEACKVFPTGQPERAYRVLAEPVFHHIQATRAKSVGSVFLFVEESGRPAAVGDVFLFPRGKKHRLQYEWHSLASKSITVQSNGSEILACPGAGLKWNDFPDAPVPASGRPERKRQLQQLARRFTAHLVDARNQKEDRFELRLLTTPLYQYQAPDAADEKADYLEGAFFAICQETDPEIFLLIEARRAGAGWKWQFAAAEFSNLNLFLELDGKEVWSANPPSFDSRGPHTAGSLPDVDLAAPDAPAK